MLIYRNRGKAGSWYQVMYGAAMMLDGAIRLTTLGFVCSDFGLRACKAILDAETRAWRVSDDA